MRRLLALAALSAFAAPLAACSGDRAGGIAATRPTGGPLVLWDLERKPFPEIPFPNDVATRLDDASATGRRLDLSTRAPTLLESRARSQLNTLDGFGTYAPITASFSAPLDLRALHERHRNDDFRDDAVYLLNVDPRCARYGEEIALDLGRGRFPVILDRRGSAADAGGGGNVLFEQDPSRASNNLIFEERDEDVNGDGRLDPDEDTDFDDHLDRPNLDDPSSCDGLAAESVERDRCVADHLMTDYDRESETLILRPVWPLEQRCTHAVVLTTRLTGEGGRAVQSPLPAVNPRDQTEALATLGPLLTRYGLGLADVAFAWTFTTGTMTTDLDQLRAGLHGSGPFAALAEAFPVESLELDPPGDEVASGGAVLPGACADLALTSYAKEMNAEPAQNLCAIGADLAAAGGFVAGTFTAPNLLADRDGLATPSYPADEDETWDLDPTTGEAFYREEKVPFACALPRKLDASCAPGNPEGKPFCAPFPVVLYAHGYGASREEMRVHLGRLAAMGMATCAIDAYGHGGKTLALGGEALPQLAEYGVKGLGPILLRGRDRDLDNDGVPDSGGDLWSADLFHTRDVIRQSALEWMQLVLILRSFDGARKAKDGTLLGDFDGDGVVDLGGPEGTIALWGSSLGGILAGVLAGAEPSLDAVSVNAGGAGLSDGIARSVQPGVAEAALLPIVGPFVVGTPGEGGRLALGFLVNAVSVRQRLAFGEIEGIAPGDRVEVRNLVNGEVRWARVDTSGGFRIAIPADALSATERRPILGLDDQPADPPVRFDDTAALGDRLAIDVFDGDTGARKKVRDAATGDELETVSRFLVDTSFQGTLYPKGATLVAVQRGLGLRRNSPAFRRYLGLAQITLDPADPAIWAPRYFEDPIDAEGPRVLAAPTSGDMSVPVDTGIAIARIAGLLGSWRRDPTLPAEQGWRPLFAPDPRYGVSVDQMLIDTHVLEGVERLQRYSGNPRSPECLFDVDDLGDGRAEFLCSEFTCSPPFDSTKGATFSCPRPAEGLALRQDHARDDGSFDALRIPFLRPDGQHGVRGAQPARAFDADTFFVNFTARFLRSRGRDVAHVPCGECSASALPTWMFEGQAIEPAQETPCTAADVKLCDAACAEAIGLRSPGEPVTCP